MSCRTFLCLACVAAAPWQQAHARPAPAGNTQVLQQVQQYQAIQQQMSRNQGGRKNSDGDGVEAKQGQGTGRKPASTAAKGRGTGRKTTSTGQNRKSTATRNGKKPVAGRTKTQSSNDGMTARSGTSSSTGSMTTSRTPTTRKRTPVRPTAASGASND